jgi:hypothetical protein
LPLTSFAKQFTGFQGKVGPVVETRVEQTVDLTDEKVVVEGPWRLCSFLTAIGINSEREKICEYSLESLAASRADKRTTGEIPENIDRGFAAALVAKQSPVEGRVSEDPESIATMTAKVRTRRRLVSLLLISSPDDGPDD